MKLVSSAMLFWAKVSSWARIPREDRVHKMGLHLLLFVQAFGLSTIAGLSSEAHHRVAVGLQNSVDRSAEACAPCHQAIYDSYVKTAHYRTSEFPDSRSIHGSFEKGKNILRTGSRTTYFRMERDRDAFYQTAHWRERSRERSRRERFDIVVGSGRKGQTYLYWNRGLLYQLPVSYLAGIDDWINSPGFIDGEVNFDRVISPRCLDCHSTHFELTGTRERPRFAETFQLGITCTKCHGVGEKHIAQASEQGTAAGGQFILNPRFFPRERQFDSCALCHSGPRDPIRPTFSYRPGENLGLYLTPESIDAKAEPDVHANQVAMIRKSRCYVDETLTCSTCHNVHRTERDLAMISKKCLICHEPAHCGFSDRMGVEIGDWCVECHMPNQESRVLKVNRPNRVISPAYRNHIVAIYPDVSKETLKKLRELKGQ